MTNVSIFEWSYFKLKKKKGTRWTKLPGHSSDASDDSGVPVASADPEAMMPQSLLEGGGEKALIFGLAL